MALLLQQWRTIQHPKSCWFLSEDGDEDEDEDGKDGSWPFGRLKESTDTLPYSYRIHNEI
jgi:hypothetical protein